MSMAPPPPGNGGSWSGSLLPPWTTVKHEFKGSPRKHPWVGPVRRAAWSGVLAVIGGRARSASAVRQRGRAMVRMMEVRRRRAGRFVGGAGVSLEQLERDPHALLARLHEREPVSWLPALDGWLV